MFWEQSKDHIVEPEQRDEEQSGANESPAEGSRGRSQADGRREEKQVSQ